MKLTVIIPVFNEEGNIRKLVSKVHNQINKDDQLIVVDDGSTDKTFDEIDSKLCTIIRHKQNLGKGEAFKSGIKAAKGHITMFMDGDCQDDPKEFPILIEGFKSGADFVIGSRFIGTLTDKSITKINFFGNKFLTLLFNLLFKVNITDSQASFKCMKTDKLKNMKLKSTRYEIEIEMLIVAIKMGYKIIEVPVTRYQRQYGISKLYQIPFGRIKFGLRILFTMIIGRISKLKY